MAFYSIMKEMTGEVILMAWKDTEICLFAKILCIADAFDAMTSDRPYRKGMSMENAINEIERCKGTQFDIEIATMFIEMSKQIINN